MLDGSLEKTTVKYMYALEWNGRLPWPERPASGLSGTDSNSARPIRPDRFGRIASARPLRSGRFGQTVGYICRENSGFPWESEGGAIGKGGPGPGKGLERGW